MFIDGLDPAIKTLVARQREAKRRITYLELIQFARSEGEAHRARQPRGRPSIRIPDTGRKRHHVSFLESPSASQGSLNRRSGDDLDNVHLLQEDASLPSTELPSTSVPSTDTAEVEAAALIQHRFERTPAPRIPYGDAWVARGRPGWEDRRRVSQRPQGQAPPSPRPELICHACYAKGSHISPRCTLTLAELHLVVSNYESLTPLEQSRVPKNSYYRAKAQFGADGSLVAPAFPPTRRAEEPTGSTPGPSNGQSSNVDTTSPNDPTESGN